MKIFEYGLYWSNR